MFKTVDTLAAPPGQPFSQSPFPGLPRLALLLGFMGVALGGCLDYSFASFDFFISHAHFYYCCVLALLLALADREGDLRLRLKATLGGLGLSLAVLYLLHKLGDNGHKRREVVEVLANGPALYLWALTLWLAAPIFLERGRRYSGWFKGAAGVLLVYGLLCLASAAASVRPEPSLNYFAAERATCLAILFSWLRAVQFDPALRRQSGRAVLGLLAGLMLMAALVGLADLLGGESLRARLAAWNLVYVEAYDADPTLPRRRLIFPMLHFNRTAYLGMIACMTLFVAQFARQLKAWAAERLLGLAGAGAAFFTIVQSYTRGIVMATLAGLCLWACLVSRRALVAIVSGCVLLAFLLPADRRNHLLTVFSPATYDLESDGPMTSMRLRLIAWDYGVELVQRHPLTGIGFGTRIIRRDYERHVRKIGDARLVEDLDHGHGMQHFHNLWLETAAESGIPAALALLGFCLVRWTMLARNFRRAQGTERRRVAAWIALECALMVAGLIFFMLKKNFGFSTWFVWIYSLSESEAAAQPTPAPPLAIGPAESAREEAAEPVASAPTPAILSSSSSQC